MKNALALAIAAIAIGACSSSNSSPPGSAPAGGTGGDGGAGGAGGSAVGAGGPGGGAGGAGGAAMIAVLSGTVCGDLQLASAQTIPAGQTVTICAGTTLTATTTDAVIVVQGTLAIAGTAQSPVNLRGLGNPGDWQGINILRGGSVTATYLEIHDANVALSSRAGSTFDIDHVVIDDSNQLLLLASGGTLAHGALHGLGANQGGTPVLIDDGSPRITDTVVDQGAYNGVDNIVAIGAGSAPVFDHVEVADSHCAFHFNEGTGATISNSFVHHNAYGLMVVDSADGHIDHNNFEDNLINIGACSPSATAEVADNYFVGAAFDSTCGALTVTGTTPAGAYTTGVGPSP